jgi:hypothetical protein
MTDSTQATSSSSHQGAQPRAVMLTFSSPAHGASVEDFSAWYNDEHIPAILEHVAGVSAVTRYRLNPGLSGGEGAAAPFLAVYEFDREPEEVLAEFASAADSLAASDLLDQGDHAPITVVYEFQHHAARS